MVKKMATLGVVLALLLLFAWGFLSIVPIPGRYVHIKNSPYILDTATGRTHTIPTISNNSYTPLTLKDFNNVHKK
jgi:hypothetical protein